MNWLISANPRIYDHASSFEDHRFIDWRQGQTKYSIGDIVYVYCAKPEQAIRYKCQVTRLSMSFDDIRDDKEYWVDNSEYEKSLGGLFFRLELIDRLDTNKLNLATLLDHGLKAAPQSPVKLDGEILSCIESEFLNRDSVENNGRWSDEELRASVDAYREMLSKHRRSESYSKKEYYRALSKRFGRTEKSFEYRAQNISHVLELLGREWLPGLVPARNVGINVIRRIEQILAQEENSKPSGSAEFEARVRGASKKKATQRPKGNNKPSARTSETTTYDRDPDVKAWVLDHASGTCECCGADAPFLKNDGSPFLEVHHVWLIADGGPDCVENAVAVCPNCHRALHYSRERNILKDSLFKDIDRLKR